ncbi:hypothetical protein M0802_001189 [Mischocyttarus mexicanus]|nr:hypothetical protein M0802_001189 [Mischocyttarus mexicanus]
MGSSGKDVSQVPVFLVLLTCVVGTLSSSSNDRAVVPNSVERNRRYALSEFLIPPPLPQSPSRVFPGGRTGRTANPHPVESPGYFSKIISWFNPFTSGTSVETPQPLPPPPPPPETLHPPKFLQSHIPPLPPSGPPPQPSSPSGFPLGTLQVYNAPIPPVFDRPPLVQPPSPSDVYNKLKPQVKDKNCNPCNKAPWLPMNYQGTYLPPHNQGLIAAASQEVKVPNFFYAPPLIPEHNVPPVGPLPNPHLYPGPIPPLFKAELFDYTSQPNYPVKGNLQHREIPVSGVIESSTQLPLISIYQNNNSGDKNLGIPQEGQTIFESHQISDSRLSQNDFGNQGYSHSNSQNGGIQIDSFSSASHENQQGSVVYPNLNQENDPTLIKQHLDNPRINQFSELPNISGNFEQTNFGNNQQFVDSSGLDFQRTDQTLSPSGIGNDPYVFGNTGSGQQSYNGDASSNIGTVKDSHASGTDGFSNVENPIYFEQSPLTDLTKTSESRTDSPSISSSSSSFVDIDEKINTQTPTDYESSSNSFQLQEEINRLALLGGNSNNSFPNYSTENTEITDLFGINQINEQKWKNNKATTLTNESLENFDTSFVPPQLQSADSWLVVLSTTMRTIQDETLLDNLGNNNKDKNRQNHSLQQYGGKRNKQVQVIIPYTSQYTPLPFHSSYDNKDNVERTQSRAVSFVDASNRDSYVSKESKRENKVINIPESVTVSGEFNTLEDHTTKLETTTEPVSNILTKKINNSIDVHRLQKNIDNWTIQEYSRGTTFSTILPSSSRPYLQPSKKIPHEYFTTTESVERVNDHDQDNVKSFALAGFSFNDIEDEGPNSFEESRIQTISVENPTTRKESNKSDVDENKSMNDTTKKSESTWKVFPKLISTIDKEKVYVVTPQTTTTTTTTTIETEYNEEENKSSINSSKKKDNVVYSKNVKTKQDEFEKIERAYQVLPQAVNNLAVASTGPENLPLWGIMEHEEFASLVSNSDENNDDESIVAPILYSGHSRVF